MTDGSFHRLRYEVGPGAFGRPPKVRALAVTADGELSLDLTEGPARRSWRARLTDPLVVERLRAALADAGFPAAPPAVARKPGSTSRVVTVDGEGGTRTVKVEYNQAERLAGWSELFRILDSLVAQVGGAEAALRPTFLPPVVAQVRAAP